MTPLQVFLISAIVVQVVSADDAIVVSEVDRHVRGSQNSFCGTTVYASRGLMYSPNYPSNYENSMDCKTRIIPQVSGRYNMKFYFCDFLTETGFFGCADYVTLNTSTKICGDRSNTYNEATYASGSLTVVFHSDRTITKRGYKIAFCADCYSVVEVKALCHNPLTTRRPNTTTRKYRTTTRSGFTYPRHKRGFFFPKKRTTASYTTYTRRPTGGFTYPFTFRYPH